MKHSWPRQLGQAEGNIISGKDRDRLTGTDWRDLYLVCFPMVKIPYPLRTVITHLQIAELAYSQITELAYSQVPELAHADRMIEGRQKDSQTHNHNCWHCLTFENSFPLMNF